MIISRDSVCFYILFVLSGLVVCSACGGPAPISPTPIPGIDQPLNVDGIELLVNEAQTRHSYQTQYIMSYPEPSKIFYEVVITIEGVDEPEGASGWGVENLKLMYQGQEQDLEVARWRLVGDDIVYRVGEDFNYRYVYIYEILEEANHEEFALQLPGGETIELATILQKASSIEGTPLSERGPQSGAVVQGEDNLAAAPNSTVCGGSHNQATAYHTTICGGELNKASAAYATISGGRENKADMFYSTIGGGFANVTFGRDSTIGGGSRNMTGSHYATVGGGIQNQAISSSSTIAGGAYNQANELYASIGGGTRNVATGYGALIGGGVGNSSSGDYAAISGGLNNQATGDYSTISGGYANQASGDYSIIPGGSQNRALGTYSLAAGRRAIIDPAHSGTFLFADSSDFDFPSDEMNEFAVRANGGVRFVTAIEADGAQASGVKLAPGSGSWASLSDQSAKTNITPVDEVKILEKLIDIPITTWSYRSQDSSIRHIGPMAQDFFSAFELGEDVRYVNTMDADGVALAAIQGLYHRLEEKEAQIQVQEQQIKNLEHRLSKLEREGSHQITPINLLLIYSGLVLLAILYIHTQVSRYLHIKS